MLRPTAHLNGDHKTFFESSRRHAVRNLRAKVRSLLPLQICNKHQRRNNKVGGILKRMQSCKCPHSPMEYFVSAQNSAKHMFFNLNPAEIEQINEDKMYFIGDDQNLQLYEDFLRKHSSATLKEQVQPFKFTRSTQHKLISGDSEKMHRTQKSMLELLPRTEENWLEKYQHKKEELEEENRIKRQMTAVKLRLRHEEAGLKRSELFCRKVAGIKVKNLAENERILAANALQATKVSLLGDITHISEELRKICLRTQRVFPLQGISCK